MKMIGKKEENGSLRTVIVGTVFGYKIECMVGMPVMATISLKEFPLTPIVYNVTAPNTIPEIGKKLMVEFNGLFDQGSIDHYPIGYTTIATKVKEYVEK